MIHNIIHSFISCCRRRCLFPLASFDSSEKKVVVDMVVIGGSQ